MEISPEYQFMQNLCDPESHQYNELMADWVGQLREWKHESRFKKSVDSDYGIYHACKGIFKASRYLITEKNIEHTINIGNAVIYELTNALPVTAEGSEVRQSIEDMIGNIRRGIESLQTK